MTLGLWSIFFAGLLPYFATAFAKWGFENYDNNNPRQWLANQTGFRARANAAQANCFESFPFFAAAILVATYTKAPQVDINLLAITYLLARVSYIACYLLDKAALRSLCWLVGILAITGLFVISAIQ
jgi:uncharacterized MAPEG superfamily protein